MSSPKLRAWWSHRQGLDGRLTGASAATVLAETGWARSVAGVNPYFTLRSRSGIGRKEADSAVAKVEIHELPTARGCTYVLPAEDFALGLAAGEPFRDVEFKTALKLGVTETEMATLCEAVLVALEQGVLSPDEIRDATGDASRSLGEEGKKKGVTTTLPVALGRLQARGEIRRVPIDGRLDQQRYKYTLWRPNPRTGFSLSPDDIQVELARRFFHWIGPATVVEFQTFAALGVGAAKKAIVPLNLQPIDAAGQLLILPEMRDAFEAFEAPKEPQYNLVSNIDALTLLRHATGDLIDLADGWRPVFDERKISNLGSLTEMPNHGIVDRGRLIGLWEYDIFTHEIVWISFIGKNEELVSAVRKMEAYVRDELGDARSFSLDSPKSRAPKVEFLRNA